MLGRRSSERLLNPSCGSKNVTYPQAKGSDRSRRTWNVDSHLRSISQGSRCHRSRLWSRIESTVVSIYRGPWAPQTLIHVKPFATRYYRDPIFISCDRGPYESTRKIAVLRLSNDIGVPPLLAGLSGVAESTRLGFAIFSLAGNAAAAGDSGDFMASCSAGSSAQQLWQK